MRAILEFSLPEESEDHKLALDGGRWCSAVHDLDEQLRSMAKHGEDAPIAPSAVRKMLYDILDGHALAFD